jgi:hypothetical protein
LSTWCAIPASRTRALSRSDFSTGRAPIRTGRPEG